MGNYTLQKYKGTATRHTCPSCGDKRSFTYYVDEGVFPSPPRMPYCQRFIFWQAEVRTEVCADTTTSNHRLHTAKVCGEVAKRA